MPVGFGVTWCAVLSLKYSRAATTTELNKCDTPDDTPDDTLDK